MLLLYVKRLYNNSYVSNWDWKVDGWSLVDRRGGLIEWRIELYGIGISISSDFSNMEMVNHRLSTHLNLNSNVRFKASERMVQTIRFHLVFITPFNYENKIVNERDPIKWNIF